MTTLAELKVLYVKQRISNAKLGETENFIQNCDESTDITEIKNRLTELSNLKSEFEAIIIEIITKEDEREDEDNAHKTNISELIDFETRWYKALSHLQKILTAQTPSEDSESAASRLECNSNNSSTTNVRLPVINLPEFNGAYTAWLPFFDAFRSLIHENNSLSDCQKFHYLKSCLKGEASRSIESLTVSNSNYATAWALLQKRYKNNRLIIQSHVQAMINTPEIGRATAENLRRLIDDVTANVEALRVLKVPIDSCDVFVCAIVQSKLDYNTRREFENTLCTKLPTRDELMQFIEKKFTMLESMRQENHCDKTKPMQVKANYNMKKQSPIYKTSYNTVSSKLSCYYCKQRHLITKCNEFLALSVDQRKKVTEKRNLCVNCFRDNHNSVSCKLAVPCKVCNKHGHHTLLHTDQLNHRSNSTLHNITPVTINSELSSTSANSCLQDSIEPDVILSTAVVLIEDSSGGFHKCRCLLDVGSQLNLISRSLSDKIKATKYRTNMSVWGVSASCSKTSERTDLTIQSMHTPYKRSIRCHVLDRVTADIPINSFSKSRIIIPNYLNLADPEFNVSQPIDLILGAEVFWDVLSSGRIRLTKDNLYLSETLLGWVIGGVINFSKTTASACHTVNVRKKSDEDLDKVLQKFWLQEEIGDSSSVSENTWSLEERKCEEHFKESVKRDESNGRFIVKLPFKNDKVELGDSSKAACKRFIALERKFRQDKEFKDAYIKSFNENLNSGIIEKVPIEELDSELVFFLPHSGVTKKFADPPKVRIVFDGSAKSSNGLSLNDHLMTGPNLQNELFEILVRFREHQIVISCDMEKMFLQIKIDDAHKDFQRLFWRDSEEKPIEQYRLTRLVFGLTNSPYTAMRCVRQLAEDVAEVYPETSRVLKENIFMDDILCGANNVEDAIQLCNELTSTLEKACFKLNKWNSNVIEVLHKPEVNKQIPITLNLEHSDATKVLGLWWNPITDTLCYKVQTPTIPGVLTKRMLLSCIAKIYDPIGLIAPVVIKAKILMQGLWSTGIGWDDPIPGEIKAVWEKFVNEMSNLNNLLIPRKIIPEPDAQNDLIAFCDASLRAYGASIYLRSQTPSGKVEVNLICSKTRVSPVKVISLPRLELCAAVLASKLMDKVSKSLKAKVKHKYYFSDSTVTLHYIKSNANMWQIYVANRVAQIHRTSNAEEWYHISTKINPADIISRGAYAKEFINSNRYWHGPDFLKADKSSWPSLNSLPPIAFSELPEKRKITYVMTTDKDELQVLLKFSSFVKLQRIMAYVIRFITNARKPDNRKTGLLSADEMKRSRITIFRIIQLKKFKEEVISLHSKQPIAKYSRIKNIDPFIDMDGLLRVGGRLTEASIPYNQKHPIILPSDHHVVELLIRLEHSSLLHAGPNQTLASLRSKYWILRSKSVVKKIIHGCIRCFRAAPRMIKQKMGNLPKVRLEPCRPFLNIGLDYLGPLLIKEGGVRSKRKVKVWIALFVCLVTRAVHLEIVSNLTSESFIASLKRLIARRGKMIKIYCDNATTFVGAKKELKQISDFLRNSDKSSELYDFLSLQNISWSFIPPRSPNFGGIWERLVKSTKFHFNRVVGNALLTHEELNTFIIQVESVINSRPITPISNDPTDLEVLTPSHFLIGEALTEFPEYDFREIPRNRLSHWERIHQLKQHFWKRFSKEVLIQLQQRPKWHQASDQNFPVGAMVLIGDDVPPLAWKLGRIEVLHPGPDGLSRVATVRTSRGVYKRSLRHLAILPIDQDTSCDSVTVK